MVLGWLFFCPLGCVVKKNSKKYLDYYSNTFYKIYLKYCKKFYSILFYKKYFFSSCVWVIGTKNT